MRPANVFPFIQLSNFREAVEAGLINYVGGIKEALAKLYAMIDERKKIK